METTILSESHGKENGTRKSICIYHQFSTYRGHTRTHRDITPAYRESDGHWDYGSAIIVYGVAMPKREL